ncbi:hypothetical protein AERO9AM_11105 [Aeromicrobium sp. 9AM]|nr:hypothetical protein AERO9AM_11105 [Aeromicrobium sp. 9AM]
MLELAVTRKPGRLLLGVPVGARLWLDRVLVVRLSFDVGPSDGLGLVRCRGQRRCRREREDHQDHHTSRERARVQYFFHWVLPPALHDRTRPGRGGRIRRLVRLVTSHEGLVTYSHAVQMSRLPFYLKIT